MVEKNVKSCCHELEKLVVMRKKNCFFQLMGESCMVVGSMMMEEEEWVQEKDGVC